ncbi:hypothetical protein A2U01_0043112 [Trifolium medium]|uniref:Uncharacterized protein n=1 Tax=Trifolium medium TaxID=97028 RepID=A0A392QC92_9FABA|nr:hypothetical protein [Trifolium medium]
MGDRVDALEATVEEMKTTMGTWVLQMQQHGALLAEISKQLGLQRSDENTSTNPPHGRSDDSLVQFIDGDGRSSFMGEAQKGFDRALWW